ncbi:methyltransferase domain-containing protein [Streptomyces cynarae]|uniref:Methyltransferase domain-containing protein n=1 Tax=Streptomyces cynarae TaxID=2981134 RepID=A0ABY6EC94_9ACTN|nr:methyltransferase domain-containing protein [Streptomyces cynarae]UXY24194.1 methyltransferase domain-containing protein [Streptomyces cynarae]
MNDHGVAHGFTSVDTQPRPAEWVEVLDRLSAEPFYATYKQRLQEFLRAEPGGLFLEVGAGTGDAAVALRSRNGAEVVAVDSSLTMIAQARDRGLPRAAVADGHRLPFAAGRFDGAWADRVLQHVVEPARVLDELLRVVRPGGRVVLADPDYDTQVLDIDDQELARRVLRFRADVGLRNGSLAHRHAGLLAARGIHDITVEAWTLVVRDPSAADNVMGLRTWAHTAAARGYLDPKDADRFVAQFDDAVRAGRFTYAVTFFLTAGTLPLSD